MREKLENTASRMMIIRDGQDTPRNILLQDTVIGSCFLKISY